MARAWTTGPRSPNGTEDLYKIYGESFKGKDHLDQVFAQARDVVSGALEG